MDAWASSDLPPGVEGLPLDEHDPSVEPDLGDPGHPGHVDDDADWRSGTQSVHDHLAPMSLAVAQPSRLPCPFVRPLREGMHGQDVTAVKRALVGAGYRPAALPRTIGFGATLRAELKRFQHAHGIQATGNYGEATHAKLRPFFDALARHYLALELAALRPDPGVALAHKIVAVAMFTLAHPTAIGYSMGPRRMEGVTRHLHPPELPGTADCSSLVTWDYFVPGGPDPNGQRPPFNGLGFTGTIAAHCVEVQAPGPPAALWLYGDPPNFEHVAIGLGDGTVISHGTPVTKHVPGDYRAVGRVVVPPELLALLAKKV